MEDADCPVGKYCVADAACHRCSTINSGFVCDDCCSVAFRTQCPTNPAQCCEVDADCPRENLCTAGHCGYPGGDGAALLAAFVRDLRTGVAWGALRGWRNATDDPCGAAYCGFDAYPRCAWTGAQCTTGRVVKVDLSLYPGLGFELGPAVGELAALQQLYLYGLPLFSGTIPSNLGQLPSLTQMLLYENKMLSGTTPSELSKLPSLTTLFLDTNPRLSGTIPPELGQLASLDTLDFGDNPMLSGTIPSQLGQLANLQVMNLNSIPRLSGAIPYALGLLTSLTGLFLGTNPMLTGTIPSALGQLVSLTTLQLHDNPRLSGSLPAELNDMSSLSVVNLHGSTALSGSLPDLSGATHLTLLDASNCSFSGLPAALPPSINHLYLNNNPLISNTAELSALLSSLPAAALHVLDIGFSNSPIVLEYDVDDNSPAQGTRVYNPTQCHIGAPCAFVLHMVDSDDREVHVGALIFNLALRFNGSATPVPMVDERDGTFTAAIPDDWIDRIGSYLFHFEHNGTEFRPMKTEQNTKSGGSDCHTPQQTGGPCTALRTVEFLARQCPEGSHTAPDTATGATCNVCEKGFEKDTGTNSTTLNCFKSCGIGETVSHDGNSCVCTRDYYDTSMYGVIICSTGGWEPQQSIASFTDAQATRAKGSKCASCPKECLRCENGTATVLSGWRLNASTTGAMSTQLAMGKDGRPQHVYSCPYTDSDCPEMELSSTADVTSISCPYHHTGPLCASCDAGFSRRGSSDNACNECSDISDYITATFGLSAGWFAAILIAVVVVICAVIYLLLAQLRWLKTETKANLRILIGSAQVLSLLPAVLELIFPPQPKAALSFIAVFVVDLREVLRFECWGWTWFDKWLASVLGIPLLVMLPIVAHWLWCCFTARRTDIDSRQPLLDEARHTSVGALFFFAMLIYPQLSASILSALRCRSLGEESSYLEADYSVDCMSERYSHYRASALVMVAIVPSGFPLGLLAALIHQWRQSRKRWNEGEQERSRDGARESLLAELVVGGDLRAESLAQYHRKRAEAIFGFCTEDYRAECFWFEPVDMLRKLALSGLLQFVHRGTATQCFCGSMIAFASFGAQLWLRPYREPESNVLKALVDTQLFLTFLISFILRVLPDIDSAEPVHKEFYGWLLLSTMIALLGAAFGLTLAQVRRRQRFKGGLLLFDEGQMGTLTRGNSGHWSSGMLRAEDPEPPLATTATGLSRPASPSRDAAAQAEPEPEPELAGAE
eukprot:COSAG02_NODE_3709_length_6347_cov_2.619558_1_plen_1235_part_00